MGTAKLEGTKSGSGGADRVRWTVGYRVGQGGTAWRKSLAPGKIFATLPPGGREEVCTLAFTLRFQ